MNETLTTDALKGLVIEAMEDMKARDITVLDVRGMTTVTDYMVIASGTSDRHLKSISDSIVEATRNEGIKPVGVEGGDSGEWVLVDLGDVVAHIMLPQTRAFYNLEKLWNLGESDETSSQRGGS